MPKHGKSIIPGNPAKTPRGAMNDTEMAPDGEAPVNFPKADPTPPPFAVPGNPAGGIKSVR